jgi:hypothetical protein
MVAVRNAVVMRNGKNRFVGGRSSETSSDPIDMNKNNVYNTIKSVYENSNMWTV